MNENQSFDDKLMEAARALETEVAPEHDLWPDIENAIARPSRTRRNTVCAQAPTRSRPAVACANTVFRRVSEVLAIGGCMCGHRRCSGASHVPSATAASISLLVEH